MAFNKSELILDRVRSMSFSDLETGELLFRLTSLEDPTLNCTAESEEVTDALGSVITTLYRAKKATFSATNSLLSLAKFAWNDTAQENTPYKVAILTKSVEMELRGSESQLQKVDVNNLSIGLTYDSVSLGVGRHKVKGVATTVGLPSGVTLVEEDIEVEIEITDPHVSDETITSDKTDSTDDTDSTVAEPTAHRTRKGGGSQ